MAAGVGKTYKMLLTARKLHQSGVDIFAGIVETFGRQETAAQLQGLPVMPQKK